jgi:hypothetical protein
MRSWQKFNRLAGIGIFGFPVLLGIIAVVATSTRFGLWTAVKESTLPLLLISGPLLIWACYARRPVITRRAKVLWLVVLVLSLVLLSSTPISFWTGPCLVVLTSEVTRVLTVCRGRKHRRTSNKNVVGGGQR